MDTILKIHVHGSARKSKEEDIMQQGNAMMVYDKNKSQVGEGAVCGTIP